MKHNCTAADLGVKYFKPDEFRGRWSEIDPRWLVCADMLREYCGLILVIAHWPEAIGINMGEVLRCEQHDDPAGHIYGLCVLPKYLANSRRRDAIKDQCYRVYEDAVKSGFTAIGFYPDWRNIHGQHNPGFYLGTHRERRPGNPLTWGAVRYQGTEEEYTQVAFIDALDETEARIK